MRISHGHVWKDPIASERSERRHRLFPLLFDCMANFENAVSWLVTRLFRVF